MYDSTKYMNFGQVARLMNVLPLTVIMLVKKGSLPEPQRVNGLNLFLRSQIESCMISQDRSVKHAQKALRMRQKALLRPQERGLLQGEG
jgi:hypothetical protein